ncbi:DUF1552 domain-containing protein [Tautonia sociabilis]|uniref:DUF1552 domain-containing protein n=1 Tax=Tautonia sociabilis TaxID=2080755 RepID=A0A432MH76_9BACT|nr:DUF1552 domain-containing protein [Tautonia sociabilis]RUL86123.1 DUF1552 domain-containing protein [Tautonia sociabilis]
MISLSRRTVLKGLGTAMALPWLEAMAPAAGIAQRPGGKVAPTRMAFLYVPNGAHMPEWTPSALGNDFQLPRVLEPLTPLKQHLLVLSGLAQDLARAHGDGGGDHARSMACFLTGVHPVKTDGADIRAGISVDQVAAARMGHHTRLPSLELGIDPSAQSGNCDSGYSCAYSSNLSWRSPTQPVPKEINPRLVFERLFGDDTADDVDSRRRRYRKSILDLVADDARALHHRLGADDRRKVDEYLSAVREIERRLVVAERKRTEEVERPDDVVKPEGIPKDNQDHLRLMLDMLVLAFQTDQTRIATMVFANEGSNKSYNWIGIPDGHHSLSHHQGDAEKQDKIARINRYHVEQLAYFLGRLAEIREGDGTLLDHSMILYGSGIGDGNRHNHNDLPIILAGGGCGTLRTGRHLQYPTDTPLNNLYLSMLDRMDTPVDELGDSTGRLDQLDG